MQLALAPGVGQRTRQALLCEFGSPSDVLSAPPSELLRVPGVGPKVMRGIVSSGSQTEVAQELKMCRANKIGVLIDSATNETYPRALREIPDPPAVLFCLGEILPLDAMAIAMVGTRHATNYGKTQAHRLASGLARAGLTIVSGLARIIHKLGNS